MTTRRILALCGPAGSGKSTLANLLVQEEGYTRTSFANGLKTMLAGLLYFQNVDDAQVQRMLNGDLKEEPSVYLGGKTPRFAMQTLGTEWRNMVDRDLWVNVWENSIKFSDEFSDKIVVDDLRFKHEAQRVWDLGGTILRVHRSDQDVKPDSHISEQEYLTIDYGVQITNYENHPEYMLDQVRAYLTQQDSFTKQKESSL